MGIDDQDKEKGRTETLSESSTPNTMYRAL